MSILPQIRFRLLIVTVLAALLGGTLLTIGWLTPFPPGAFVVVALLASAPLGLIGTVLLARSDLEGGDSQNPKGELERLIEKKQVEQAQNSSPAMWEGTAHIVAVMILPKPQLTDDVDDDDDETLDRLVDWKRENGLAPRRRSAENEYVWHSIDT